MKQTILSDRRKRRWGIFGTVRRCYSKNDFDYLPGSDVSRPTCLGFREGPKNP